MMLQPLSIGFATEEPARLMAQIVDLHWLPDTQPTRVSSGNKPTNSSWESAFQANHELFVRWGAPGSGCFFSITRYVVKLSVPNRLPTPSQLVGVFAGLSFLQASLYQLHEEWGPETGMQYTPPGFADQHFPHGWACAFKGAGHDRLLSRRWLDRGPWKLYRDEANDVSFVLFHDLASDAATALEQAKPGHQRMGISREGGYIQTGFVFRFKHQGLYIPETQTFEIVVHGREVTQREMLEACAERHYQVLGPEKPLRNVAFVFMEESAARAHLHELWLRGLECWAIIDGAKVRLDERYEPGPAPKPEWVQRLDAATDC